MEIKITDNSDQFKSEIQDKLLRALETCGLVAEGYAKKLCPVDTGRLRNSISHAESNNEEYIGTNVEYAPYVELGTSKQRSQPYLKPAVENHFGTYKKIIETEMKS